MLKQVTKKLTRNLAITLEKSEITTNSVEDQLVQVVQLVDLGDDMRTPASSSFVVHHEVSG